MNLNLAALGITEEALTKAVLRELNMTPEQAINALADKLGVDLTPPAPAQTVVEHGQRVATTKGEATALVLTREDQAALRRAGELLASL